MKLLNFSNTSLYISSMGFFIWWAILLPRGIGVCGNAAVVIVGKRLTRSVVDCEKYVFHPHCRGLQAKKKRLDNKNDDGLYNDANNNDNNINKAENVCFCKYRTKNNSSWKKDFRSIELMKLLKQIMPLKVFIVNEKENSIKPTLSRNRKENYSSYEQPALVTLSTIADKMNESRNLIKRSYLTKQSKMKEDYHDELLWQKELNKLDKVIPKVINHSIHADVHIFIHI